MFQGRAKARDAEYIILVEEEHFDQFEIELKTYHDIEKVQSHNYSWICFLKDQALSLTIKLTHLLLETTKTT